MQRLLLFPATITRNSMLQNARRERAPKTTCLERTGKLLTPGGDDSSRCTQSRHTGSHAEVADTPGKIEARDTNTILGWQQGWWWAKPAG